MSELNSQELKKPIKIKFGTNYIPTEEDKKYQEELEKLTDKTFSDAGNTRTIKNIRENLVYTLKKKYGKTNGELKVISDGLLKIHGLHEDNFDYVNLFSKYVGEKINDVSIDANANKSEKSIKGVLKDIELSTDKLIGYDFLYRTMKELYGQEEAKRLCGEMYDLSLGLSDSSNILLPYCWAIDASRLIVFGREFGTLPSKPCKRVSSYISALCETVHQLASHLAGAVAIGSLFTDLAHLMIYKERIPLKELKENKQIRKSIENELQQFVHSVNFLSRNGNESPFTNISIFDKEKLSTFISEENYGWLFPNKVEVRVDNQLGGEDYKLSNEEYKKFVMDYVFEIQKLFLDFFDKGDPLNGGINYRFPVVTVNFSKHKDEDEKDVLSKDNELFDYITKKDISKYNIFTSYGTKICSCCRMINDTELMDMGASVNSFGGSNISLGSHRVVTTNFVRIAYEANNYDEYLDILKYRVESSAKILKAHRILIQKLAEMGLHPFLKNGWINMKRMFSTYGVLGIVEAQEIIKEKFGNKNFDYMGDILVKFNNFCKEASEKEGFIFNIEQIPAESFAVRLAKADNLIYGNPYNLDPLYANQFVPLWKDATIYERLEADGKYNQLLSGGGIVHAQINSDVTVPQAKNVIKHAVECGCEHFALNTVYSQCVNCKTVFKGDSEICPKCGEKHFEHYSRVIGFFTKVEDWNTTRRDWEFKKRKFVDLKQTEK
ncbi:MAG: hypothetical protein NC222_06620 [Staphylococcus sp.]|nr:hypothetical protein [Staphylococcus sp.]